MKREREATWLRWQRGNLGQVLPPPAQRGPSRAQGRVCKRERCRKPERGPLPPSLNEHFTEHLLCVGPRDATVLHVALHTPSCPGLSHWCPVTAAGLLSTLHSIGCMAPGVFLFQRLSPCFKFVTVTSGPSNCLLTGLIPYPPQCTSSVNPPEYS